jgi:hypothetical protein
MGNEYPDSECILFPSKDCRTWEGWTVEPKFEVGDWAIDKYVTDCVFQITKILDDSYEITEKNGHVTSCLQCDIEDNSRLWTIEDAKDGDVLSSIRGCPFIYDKYRNQRNNLLYYYAGIDGNGDFVMKCPEKMLYHFGPSTDAVPATKKQCDLLHEKMREAGYLWDAEKKELRKIFEPQFKVGDDIKTGDTIDTIAEIDYATRSYLCKSGRTIWFENQDLWHLAPKPHYDIANFKPKQWVLTRDTSEWDWELTMFAYLNSDGGSKFTCINGVTFKQCIPLNDDTKHLLGTTDPCGEEYINW